MFDPVLLWFIPKCCDSWVKTNGAFILEKLSFFLLLCSLFVIRLFYIRTSLTDMITTILLKKQIKKKNELRVNDCCRYALAIGYTSMCTFTSSAIINKAYDSQAHKPETSAIRFKANIFPIDASFEQQKNIERESWC